ncbi:MAG: hypothetical protein ACE5E1_05985 [Phycisphaerae bacterium]
MRDTERCQQVLGLSAPWSVNRVTLETGQGRVDVGPEHRRPFI